MVRTSALGVSKRGTIRGGEDRAYFEDDRSKHLWRVNWAKFDHPFVGIYAIAPDNRWPTKIGVSRQAANRLADLQIASWRTLEIFDYAYCADVAAAEAIEASVHKSLTDDGLALSGEWFDIRPDKAFEVVRFAALALGHELRTDVPCKKVADALDRVLFAFMDNPKYSQAAKDFKNTRNKNASEPLIPSIGGKAWIHP